MTPRYFSFLRWLIPLGLLGAVFYLTDSHYSTYLACLSQPYIPLFFLFIVGLFLVNFLLVAFRLYLSYRLFQCPLPYAACLKASVHGQIGNFLPFIGQMAGQSFHIKKNYHIPPALSAFIVLYERVMMFVSGIFLCGVSALLLFTSWFSSLLSNVRSLIDISLIITLCVIVTLIAVQKKNRTIFWSYFSLSKIIVSSFIFLLCLLTWLLVASSFVLSLKFMGIQIPLLALFETSLLVCFLASLPLSSNGWGLREFAAVTLFGFLSIPQEIALFVSISIGLLSLLALIPSFLWVSFFKISSQKNLNAQNAPKLILHMDRKIIYFLTCSMALFIFFQIHLTWNEVTLNVNFADPIALCGLFIVATSKTREALQSLLRLPHTPLFLILLTLVFSMALTLGLWRNGFSAFILINKFLGLFVLFGYAGLGAFFIYIQKNRGLKTITRIMTLVLCTIIFWRLIISILSMYNLVPQSFLMPGCLMGYASNRNAFCLQILSVLALLLSQLRPQVLNLPKNTYWLTSFLLMALYISFSRSGIVTGALLFISLVVLKIVSLRNTIILFGFTALWVVFIIILNRSPIWINHCFNWIQYLLSFSMINGPFIDTFSKEGFLETFSGATSDTERLYSCLQALKLWKEHPWFGIGLGTFSLHELATQGRPLIIHNTLIWILTELGIIGLIPFVSYGFLWIFCTFKNIQKFTMKHLAPGTRLLFLLPLIALPMAMAHEVFYQRILWFVWGMSLVGPITSLPLLSPKPFKPEGEASLKSFKEAC